MVTQVFGSKASEITRRIWEKDYSLWSDSPEEITNRLGWLDVAGRMRGLADDIRTFAELVRADGFTDAVLFGMGGSSLGPEVLRQSIGSQPGYPALRIFDTTSPEAIARLKSEVDIETTIFVISSKSGTTIEPNSLYAHFRPELEALVGRDAAGDHFIAVTDPGSPLESLGRRDGFRSVFLADENIGGRYSVLSHFGLIPAAIAGIDVERLLASALAVEGEIRPESDAAHSRPWEVASRVVDAVRSGRRKIAFQEDESSSGFGLWAEQLLAESLGKDGNGVVPIANEPAESPFAGLIEAWIRPRDRPVDGPAIESPISDPYELGGLFLAWEWVTAVLAIELGVHPFNQPNVQAAKDATDRVLHEGGRKLTPEGSLERLLKSAGRDDYVAIMAYLPENQQMDRILSRLRRHVSARTGVPTTAGYGPRVLHSTGQLHKGGPNNVLALQITSEHQVDFSIPGHDFTFGRLIDAQAAGDFDALRAAGRRVARLHLTGDPEAELESIVESNHQ